MKEQYKKLTTLALVASLMLSMVGCSNSATSSKDDKVIATKEKQVEDVKTTGNTVYVFHNDKDEIKKIIATDDVIDDMQVTTADKNDLMTLKEELPIRIETTYYLDGKRIDKKDLDGKTGKLKIRYQYVNNQKENVQVNGKVTSMYVPYAMLTGCILDDENFSDVTIDHGKMIDDGNHTIFLGLALPGLGENLDFDKHAIELPSSLEIEATIKDYQPIETISLATNKVFQDITFDGSADMNKLSSSMKQLDDAMNQLIQGSSQLYKGLSLLDSKSNELTYGINLLCNGSSQLKDGTKQLQDGSALLADGATSLYQGLATLCDNNETLQNGALEVFQTLLKTANDQLAKAGIKVSPLTVENYDTVLTNVIASLDEDKVYQTALAEVSKQVNANRGMIEKQVRAAVQTQVRQQVEATVLKKVTSEVEKQVESKVKAEIISSQLHMSVAQYEQALKAGLISKDVEKKVHAAIQATMASDQIQAQMQTIIKEKMASEEVKALIQQETTKQMESAKIKALIQEQTDLQVKKAIADIMASDEIQNKFQEAKQGLQELVALKTSLNKYEVFYQGILQYTNGVAAAYQGSVQLKDGLESLQQASTQLYDGASQLDGGLQTMQQQLPTLKGGITDLKNGSKQLADGCVQFNDEGIKKIVDAYDGNLKPLANRLQATLQVSKEHRSFAGVSRQTEKALTFIYR